MVAILVDDRSFLPCLLVNPEPFLVLPAFICSKPVTPIRRGRHISQALDSVPILLLLIIYPVCCGFYTCVIEYRMGHFLRYFDNISKIPVFSPLERPEEPLCRFLCCGVKEPIQARFSDDIIKDVVIVVNTIHNLVQHPEHPVSLRLRLG